jgi:hypothetical protein
MSKPQTMKKMRYEDVKFRFITNHYDVHLSGTCSYNGRIARFKNLDPYADKMWCQITELNFVERTKERLRQLWFEICVGKHWTYPDRKNGARFNRSINSILFKLYYGKWRR